MKDYAILGLGYNKTVRVLAANTTNLSDEARKIHKLWPTTSQILSRSLSVTALMSLLNSNYESITLRINGNGPAGTIVCEGRNGNVRGYLNNPEVFLQYKNNELNIKDAVGNSGLISVTKQLNNGTYYTSTSNIISGELAEDFTYYFASSEQTPSSVGLGAIIDVDNSVFAACGFIVQLMPGVSEEVIVELENKLQNLKSCSQMLKEDFTPEDIVKEILGDDCQILDQYPLGYECSCSREKFTKSIISLGKDEIIAIINEDGKAHTYCNFCMKEYNFTKEDLEEMLSTLK